MPRGSKCKYFPPQKNNNNERTEFIDDSMICDEWVDVTDKYVLKNTPTTLPVANENPPKSDSSCSEIGLFNSPRNKKRKLKMPLTFDEIVVKLNFNTLNSKFVKLLQFLESGNDEMFFPCLTKRYEDFFKMIVQDINILKSRSLDTYRDVCNKIIEVASFKNSGYLLTYNYDYRMEFKNTVLVIKKVYTKSPMNVEESSSSESNQPPPLPEMEPVQPAKRFKDSISNGFKIHCLRTALAFVKNNVTVNVEFPELSSEQAEFMQLLLESVITFADCGNDIEVNELYRALWEAVKIHSTKYDFRINTVDSYGEKKNLVFEKLPKQKRVECATYIKQRAINITPPVTENESTEINPVVFTNQPTSVNNTTVSGIPPIGSTNQPVDITNEPASNTTQLNQIEAITIQPLGEQPVVTNQPTVSVNKPTMSGIQPSVSTNQPTVTENQSTEIKPVVFTNQATINKTTVNEIQPIDSPNQPVVTTIQPMGSAKESAINTVPLNISTNQTEITINQPVDEIEPVVTNQPTLSVNKPTISEVEPGVSTNQPEVETNEPVVGEIQPIVNTNQPTDNDNQPTPETLPDMSAKPMDSTNPTADLEIQPVDSTKQLTDTENTPTLTSNQPVNKIQPVVSVNQPVFTPKQPVVSLIQPGVIVIQPLTGVYQPTFSRILPVTYAKEQYWKPQLKPKAQRKLTKIKNRSAFIYRLPRTFVYNAFETVIEFLADEKRLKMIVFPTNEDEVVFYRKCIEWTGPEHAGIFDGEYKPYYDKIVEYLTYIKCEVSKSSKQGYYKISGIREVSYTKKPKLLPNGKPVVKPPNMPKPDQIEFKVPTIYTSLRNKKKNKKLKKKNLVKVQTPKNKKSVVGVSENRISVKYSDTSSEISSSSRDASQERKVQPTKKAKKIKKALPKETEITPRAPMCNSKMTRWQSETARKEQLKEALSVPVQSDKAMKMMLSMGWSGGALGARGNGITEPIMPALDIPKGYGFGAYKITPQSEISKKPETPKTVTVWSTDSNEDRQIRSENDIIVEKTKELLLEKPCFDKLMKGLVGRPKTDPEIIDLDEYPDTDDKTNVGKNATKTARKVKMSKAERKAKNKKSKAKVPTQTRHSALVAQNPGSDIKFEPRKFRGEVLETVLELLITDTESKTLTYDIPITQKNKQYITHLLKHLKYRTNVLVAWNQQCLADEIVERYKELPDVIVESYFSDNRLEVELKKIKISTLDRDSNEIIFDKDVSEVSEYIKGTSFKCDTRKALDNLKFKVLILMKILELVKSNNEEIDIVFNKVLPKKRKNYIANLLDSFNLRQKLGDTEPEIKLSDEIRLNIRSVFLSHMFNHQFNGVTINKNFKRVIDVDNYTKKRTDKPTAKELAEMADDITDSDYDVSGNDNDVTGNSYDVSGDGNDVSGDDNDNTDDDSLDLNAEDEVNTQITGKVLPPRDETVSMYEYLYMYDPSTYSKQNKNTAIDIVIDKNDNQVIDMKNVDGQSKCMDVDEEEAENAEVDKEEIMLIDDFESEEIKFSEKFFGDKPVDVNEDCDKKTNNNIDDMIYEVLSNTETASDEKPIENISKSQVTNNLDIENKDETMREADLDNQMQENHEKEELIEVINDESSKEISEKSSRIDDEEIIKRIDDIIKQENETDCDISFDKDDLVLSEENCDNQPLNVSHSETGHMENGVDVTDIKNTEVNHVYIVNTRYPTEIITKEKAKEIQEIISEQIMLSKELPLLKCHGVQNGALIYTCHNKISFDFLENSIKDIGDLKVLNTVNVDKMAVKLFCLFDFDSVYLFNMIELYNKEISTKQWVVEKREFRNGYTIFVIKMDKESIDFIHASDLALFAGVDKVEFSLIWE